MTYRTLFVILAGAVLVMGLGGLVAQTHAFPEPAPFPITWEFDFTYGKPKPIAIKGDDGKYHWYWYLTYKVVNNSGDDRLFIPEVELATDQGDLITAGKNVPATVYPAIKAREGKPLLMDPNEVIGKMLQGEDYAKESVIIWPDFGHDIDELRIMIAGLSGERIVPGQAPATTQPETAPATAPAAKPEETYRKTLMLTYSLPGTNVPVQQTVILPRGEKWIMR